MHKRLLRWAALLIAPMTLMVLAAGPAQATGTATGHSVSASAAGPPTAAGRGGETAASAAGTRRVCGTPRRGFSACMSLLRTNVASYRGVRPDVTPTGYGPSDLQSAYNLPSATAGSGATVAIVDAGDDPTAETDLATYRSQYGLPACTTANGCFEKVNQEGQQANYPPTDGDWPVEESLDIDMVSAICPNCNILLVEADSAADGDLYAAEDEAVALGAKYVSNSWSTPEFSGETADDSFFHHPGVAITAAAGDAGYQVNYPAASQYVTSVGGTTLTRDSSVSRGWTETAWSGTGSGCSADEPKPAWQADTGCANRTVADVSADANLDTGVAIYDTTGEGGWLEAGGTSVATPVIASVYALAGTPAAGSDPARDPYIDPSALNDVTSGSNGTCTPAYLCTAGPGYDGPTGLGSPDGTAAFSGGPTGDITGRVTNTATGAPVADATVTDAQGYTTHTSTDGDYALDGVPPGRYDLTASMYGYTPKTHDGVQVTAGTATTAGFALTAIPSHTLSGTITDGSGHAWPLYAAITIPGYPGGTLYTDPYTGHYSVTLPQGATYQLQVAPVYPGYRDTTATVKLGGSNVQKNVKVTIDAADCTAPGYGWDGSTETFTGWTGTRPHDGWTVTDTKGNGQTWNFSNPGDRTPPAGDDSFAIADSGYYGKGGSQDTALVSPVQNLTGQSAPEVSFDSAYYGHSGQAGRVQLSTDGGRTWTTVWQKTTGNALGPITIPLSHAARQSDVQVRFQFTGSDGWWWAVDNVFIGTRTCIPLHGGLIAGTVTATGGAALDGATITSKANLADTGTSAPGSDPAHPDGFYWLFSSLTGSHTFIATAPGFQKKATAVNVAANKVTQQNWVLTLAGG